MSEVKGRTRKLICRCLDAPWMEAGPVFEVDFSLGTIEPHNPATAVDQAGVMRARATPAEFLGQHQTEGQRLVPKLESPYLTVAEAAAYCRLAVGTIYNHRREIQRMPGTGKLLFRREDLDSWLQARRRKR